MSSETQKRCRYVNCNKEVSEGGIETNLGWFCSEECRQAVTKRIFQLLVFPDWFKLPNLNQHERTEKQ